MVEHDPPQQALPPQPPGVGLDAWFAETYADLHRLAHARLHAGSGPALLDTAALVNESYLRLVGSRGLSFPDRLHFLSYVGKVMRSVIVDLVRQRRSERGGGDAMFVTLTTQLGEALAGAAAEDEILQVHAALDALALVDARMAQVVELRYFAGLTEVEIAAALGLNERTVRRDWQQARLFLAEALKDTAT